MHQEPTQQFPLTEHREANEPWMGKINFLLWRRTICKLVAFELESSSLEQNG